MAEETEFNVNREWDFDINLSGLQAPTGKRGNQLPTGYYKVILADLYINPDKNPNRVVIKAQVAEGPFAGVTRTDGLNKPQSAEDKVRYYWRGLAESTGYTQAQLDSGQIRLGMGTFKGRQGHMFFTAREDAEDSYENIVWLSPMEWAQQKQNFEMTGGVAAKAETAIPAAPGSALGSTEAAPAISEPAPMRAPSNSGGQGVTTKAAVLGALGVTPS